MIEFKIERKENHNVLEFNLPSSGVITPEDLQHLDPPDLIKEDLTSKAIVLSGRGPIWLYGCLVHYCHPCKAVAIFDPRLDAGVVIESHSKEYNVGDLINIKE